MEKEDSPRIHQVDLLGIKVRIKHDDETYVRKLEAFVKEKIRSIPSQLGVTNLEVAVRVLLVLADEYFSALKEKETIERSVEDRARKMLDFLDENVDVFGND